LRHSGEITDDERAIRYLLGQMPEPERDRFEEEYFASSDLLRQIKACEEQLIEEYLEDRLAADRRGPFETHFAASPRIQQQLRLTRALMKLGEKDSLAQITPEVFAASAFQRREGITLWLPVAAALILAGVCGWLVIQNVKLRDLAAGTRAEAEAARSRESDLADQINSESKKNDQLGAALEQERARSQDLQRSLEALSQQRLGSQPAAIASFLLIPDNLRAISEPQMIELAASIILVRLELRLEPDDYKSYQAELRTTDEQLIWNRANIKATNGTKHKVLFLRIPVALLKEQTYLLAVKGIKADREVEDAAHYRIQVKKKKNN
jgi:hypothetical protein